MLMFCSLYVFDLFPDSNAFPFKTFFCLGCMYFFALLNQITYTRYLVGKSAPFSISQNALVHRMLPTLRGCAFFLAVITHSIFIIKTYRKIHSYPNPNELISFKMSSFVCVFICSISSCSSSPFPVVVDPSSILTISPTSP